MVDRLTAAPGLPPPENPRKFFVNIGSKYHTASLKSSMYRLLTGQTRRGNEYGEETYTKKRDTQHTRERDIYGDTNGEETHMERRHTWRGNTYEEKTHMERRHMERRYIRKREEGYDMYGEGTRMERGQTRRGDYIRKGLLGEGTHTEKGDTKKRLYREKTT